MARGGLYRRRRISNWSEGGAVHRDQWNDCFLRRAARADGVGLVAVPLLRAQSADETLRSARGSSARGATGNWRRVWRQRRISVDDRWPCGAAGNEVGESGENYL